MEKPLALLIHLSSSSFLFLLLPLLHLYLFLRLAVCLDLKRQIEIRRCDVREGFFSFKNYTCAVPPPVQPWANASAAVMANWTSAMNAFNESYAGRLFWEAQRLNATNATAANLTEVLGTPKEVKTPSDEYFQ